MPVVALTPKESLQSRKQEVVRQQIWHSAIDLFHSLGFDSVTIEQISASAGVSRRTFFRYFSSKEDVLASSVRSYVDRLAETIISDSSECNSFDAARRAISAVLGPSMSSSERVMQIARKSASARNAHMHQGPLVQEKLANAFATRENRKDGPGLEDRILAYMVLCATSLCVEIWIENNTRDLTEIVDEVFSAIASVAAPQACFLIST